MFRPFFIILVSLFACCCQNTQPTATVYVLDSFGDVGEQVCDISFNVVESTEIIDAELIKLCECILQNTHPTQENKIKTYKAFNPEIVFKIRRNKICRYYYVSFYENEIVTPESAGICKLDEEDLNLLKFVVKSDIFPNENF